MTARQQRRTAILIALVLTLGIAACSTMVLDKYPEPAADSFRHAKTIEGIAAIARPLLGGEESERYFGVDLSDIGILAVYLSVKNTNLDKSYTLPADSVSIGKVSSANLMGDPSRGDRDAGEALGAAGALLISPILNAAAIQQLSDASIIRENFDASRLRTKTLDPGETVSGFCYFDQEILKKIKQATVCFTLIDPLSEKVLPYCLPINFRG